MTPRRKVLADINKPFAKNVWDLLWKPVKSPIQVVVELQGNNITEDGKLQVGCRAGPSIEAWHFCHEVCHFVEIDDERMLMQNWGLRVPEKWVIDRFVCEPETLQATERELRTLAYQWHLHKLLNIKSTPAAMVSALVYMPDFWLVPGGWSKNDEKRLKWCADRMMDLTKDFHLDRFMAEWKRKNALLNAR